MLNCCTFKENRVKLSLWGTVILFPCYSICGISYYIALTVLNTRFGDVVISKLLSQFCIIFRLSLFFWFSFKTVIYFMVFQRVIFYVVPVLGWRTWVGRKVIHNTPEREGQGMLSCREWLPQNFSGDSAGKLRRLAVTEPPCWLYSAQEHCHFCFSAFPSVPHLLPDPSVWFLSPISQHIWTH